MVCILTRGYFSHFELAVSDLLPVGDSLSMSIGVPLLTVAERLRNSSISSLFCWEEGERERERERGRGRGRERENENDSTVLSKWSMRKRQLYQHEAGDNFSPISLANSAP